MKPGPRDGLYRVETELFCAGFVLRRGRLVACAPILRRHIARWLPIAEWVGP